MTAKNAYSPARLSASESPCGNVRTVPVELRGYQWSERPDPHEVWTLQCANCHLWYELEAFPANPRVRSGRSSWCRGCHLERQRRWREENAEYVAAYNAGRREGPFAAKCVDCKFEFEASRRMQKRCPSCQAEHRRKR